MESLDRQLRAGSMSLAETGRLEGLLQRNVQNPKAHILAGEVLAHFGLEHEALEQFMLAGKASRILVVDEFHRVLKEQPYRAHELVWYVAQQFPNDSGVLYEEGLLCLANHKIVKARQKFEQAIKQPVPWPDSYARLSQLALEAGQYAQSATFAGQELRRYPHNMRARRMKVLAQWRSGAPLISLEKDLPALLRDQPGDQYINYIYGLSLYQRGRFEMACEPALLALGHADNKSILAQCQTLILNLHSKVPPNVLSDLIDKTSPGGSKNIVSTLLRLRMSQVYLQHGDQAAAKKQLLVASNMHPYLAPAIAQRLAQLGKR